MKRIAILLLFTVILAAVSPVVSVAAPMNVYPHYLEENAARYEAYRTANPGFQLDIVIAYVNANVDLGGYRGITQVKNPDSISVLVNKNFILPLDFSPGDLVSIDNGFRLRKEAAGQLSKMMADMSALGLKLHVMAGYRTVQKQSSKHSGAVSSSGLVSADIQFARPGHSEHQTGLAVDIVQRTGIKHMTQAMFETSAEFEWLTVNAHKYGFILRYPEEYTDIHGFIFEPWHWRYVGVSIATAMYNDGIAMFEEYYGWHLAPGILAKTEKVRILRVPPAVIE